eukprot:752790-Pleurochrysis_carterae.AAC.1
MDRFSALWSNCRRRALPPDTLTSRSSTLLNLSDPLISSGVDSGVVSPPRGDAAEAAARAFAHVACGRVEGAEEARAVPQSPRTAAGRVCRLVRFEIVDLDAQCRNHRGGNAESHAGAERQRQSSGGGAQVD